MTVDEKVSLVRDYSPEYGLNQCCEALALSKGTWHYRKQGDDTVDADEELLKTRLREVIGEHPGYGYRRLNPELEARTGQRINHKRLRRLLREMNPG